MRRPGWSGKALIVLACVAYQLLVFSSVGSAPSGVFHYVLLWLPLAAFAGWILARSRNKALLLALLAAAGGVVFMVEYQEQQGLSAVSGISHATAYLFLLWYFGQSLARGREPVVTRYARSVHGSLEPGIESFTRRVTIAWCVFFAAQPIASVLLLAFGSVYAWSLFINLLNIPLLGLMFAGQFAYRMIRYPDYPRASVWRAIEAFTKDASLSRSAEVR